MSGTLDGLMLQSATSNRGRGGNGPPYSFTEYGAIMAAKLAELEHRLTQRPDVHDKDIAHSRYDELHV
jgi:hypothetical protein